MNKFKEFFKKNKTTIFLSIGIFAALYILLIKKDKTTGNGDIETPQIALSLPQARTQTSDSSTTTDTGMYSRFIQALQEQSQTISENFENLQEYTNLQSSLLNQQLTDMKDYVDRNLTNDTNTYKDKMYNTNNKLSNLLNGITKQKIAYSTSSNEEDKTQAHLMADTLRQQAIALATSEGLDVKEIDTGVGYKEYEINGMRL